MEDKDITYIKASDFETAAEKVDKSKIKDLSTHNKLAPYSVGGADTTRLYLMDMLNTPRKTPTGINELSASIGGGYPMGLSVMGGPPNTGKTTMCVQSAVEMAKKGYPSVFCSYDMAGFQIIDKVYSQISYELFGGKGYTLQDLANRKLLDMTEQNSLLIRSVVDVTQLFTVIDMLDTENLQNIIGMDYGTIPPIKSVMDMYCSVYDHPTFFIDNLQQFVGYMGYEGKLGVDMALNMLKAYAREYQVPIVLISTLGRASYDKTLELSSFKESGNIDYAVDVAFGIEPKFITDGDEDITIDDFRVANRRDITIKCVKSRDAGFQKRYITLNAPYCRFEPYDETRPNTPSKKKRQKVTFVDD